MRVNGERLTWGLPRATVTECKTDWELGTWLLQAGT